MITAAASKYRRGEVGRATQLGFLIHQEDNAQKVGILDELDKVSAELETNQGRVALAWVGANEMNAPHLRGAKHGHEIQRAVVDTE